MTTQNINNVETAGALADADLMLLFRPGQDEEIIKTLASMKAEFAADAAESNILFASASAFVGGEIQLTFGTRLFPSEPDTLLIAFVMPDISAADAADEVVVTLPLSSSSFRDYTVNDTEVNTLSYSSFETGAVYAMLIRSGGANLIRTDVVSDDSTSDASVGGSILVASGATYDADDDAVILAFGTDVYDERLDGVMVVFTMPDASADVSTDQLSLAVPRSSTQSWFYEMLGSDGSELTSGNDSLIAGTRYAVILRNVNALLVKTDLGGSGTGGTLSNEDPEEITVDGDAAPGDSDEGARINHVHPLQNLRGRVPIAYGTATYSGSRMDIVADGYRHDIADTILVVRVPVASTTAVSPTVINVRVGTNPQQSAIGTTGGSGIPGGTFYPGTYYIWMHTNNQYRLLTAGAHADSRWISETANGAAATITPEQLRLAIAAHSTGEENVQSNWDEVDDTSDAFIMNKPDLSAVGEENVQSNWDEADDTSDAFIMNKPDLSAVGEENVQSDWDEADNTSDSFILNKPVVVLREDLVEEIRADTVGVSGIGILLGQMTAATQILILTADSTYSSLQMYDVLRVENELMHIISLSSLSTLTVRRGAFGTTAVLHADGTSVDYVGYGRGRQIAPRTWVPNSISNENVFDLGRALDADADGTKVLNFDTSYIATGVRHYDRWDINVAHFLRMLDRPLVGSTLNETAGHMVTRAGNNTLEGSAVMEFVYGRHVLSAADETAGLGTEGNTALVLAIRGGAQTLGATNFQAGIYLTPMNDGVGGSGGQQAEGSGGGADTGLRRERLYQAIDSALGLPLDPTNIWDVGEGEFETNFSPWNRVAPVLTSDEILAVADGFSILDAEGVRQNGIWSKFFSSNEQYCSIIQDNDTYTLDSTVSGLRFVRSLLASGWGPWKPLENATDGWVEIVSAANIHAQDVDSTILRDIPNVDCQWFREIEIEYWPEGTTTGQNPGGKGQYHYRRTSGNWTARYNPNDDIPELGSFKLRYYDEWGLSGSAALSNSFSDDYAGNISGPSTSAPVRRYSFMVSLIGQNANNPNLITSYQIGPFSGVNKYGKIVVRMR